MCGLFYRCPLGYAQWRTFAEQLTKRGLPTLSKIRGIILDIDGTLVDSNDAHARAWVEALAEHGVNVPFEEVRRLIGMGGDKLLPKVSGLSEETPEGEAISKRRGEI